MIFSAKKKNPQADTNKLEAKIDQMVYKLYGLTEAEKAIIKKTGGNSINYQSAFKYLLSQAKSPFYNNIEDPPLAESLKCPCHVYLRAYFVFLRTFLPIFSPHPPLAGQISPKNLEDPP